MKRVTTILWLLATLVLVTACDKGRMWETEAVRPHEEPIAAQTEEIVPFYGGEALYRAEKGENLASEVEEDNPLIIAEGQKRYAMYCAQCHGKNLDGKGTVGQSFKPLPTDLRSDKVLSQPSGVIFQTISYGKENIRQPALATTIAPMDRWRIIAYIKSLGPR